jgi:hypothetical protein
MGQGLLPDHQALMLWIVNCGRLSQGMWFELVGSPEMRIAAANIKKGLSSQARTQHLYASFPGNRKMPVMQVPLTITRLS